MTYTSGTLSTHVQYVCVPRVNVSRTTYKSLKCRWKQEASIEYAPRYQKDVPRESKSRKS